MCTTLKNSELKVEGIEIQTKCIEKSFEGYLPENLLNLGKGMGIQIWKAYGTPNRDEQKRISPCHIIVKYLDYRTKREY
jgi:hypothetical protein